MSKDRELRGQVRHSSMPGGQGSSKRIQFRLEQFDPYTGDSLGPVSVQAGFSTNGMLADGDTVTAIGSFNRDGQFKATRVINHTTNTELIVKSEIGAVGKHAWVLGVPFIFFGVIALVIFVAFLVLHRGH